MKALQTTALAFLMLISLSANAEQPIIHFSIGGEISPGIYGQVQFGNAPPPPVLHAEPIIIARPPSGVVYQPLYLHVPPGHAKNWSRYCRRYNACNRPVYFVRSREYEPGYSPRKEKRHKNQERKHKEHNDGHSDEGRGDQWRDERR